MKILIIDRDRLNSQMVANKAEAQGHTVIEEAVKNNAIELVGENNVDAVFFDPAPLTSARPIVLGIRRTVVGYTYICMMSPSISEKEAIDMGANDLLAKPLDSEDFQKKLQNAKRMVDLVKRIGDESEDFPSAGGVIAKSAFNQLFLSAIDRADRYGENSYIVFIRLNNYDDIKTMDGAYAAEYAVSKMAQYLVRLRRQSDIIAQTGVNEYALLLQRPQQKDEPIEAANRFAASLSGFEDIVSGGNTPVEIKVSLVDIPVCEELYSKTVVHQPRQAVETN